MSNVYEKLQQARIKLQNTQLKKSGQNKFAGYSYFELGDFLPTVQNIFSDLGLFGHVSFNSDLAVLNIRAIDKPDETIQFLSPMSEASLKGCHAIQNLGAVQTYLRRYLWVNALEIVEHDALDATTGKDETPKKATRELTAFTPEELAEEQKIAETITGLRGEWQIKVTIEPGADTEAWLDLVQKATFTALELCTEEKNVMDIFTKNERLFDKVKSTDLKFFQNLTAKFNETFNKLKEKSNG